MNKESLSGHTALFGFTSSYSHKCLSVFIAFTLQFKLSMVSELSNFFLHKNSAFSLPFLRMFKSFLDSIKHSPLWEWIPAHCISEDKSCLTLKTREGDQPPCLNYLGSSFLHTVNILPEQTPRAILGEKKKIRF